MTDGEDVKGSEPTIVLGNAITSRIEGQFRRMLSKRSNPIAKPPWGGQPCFKAFNKCENYIKKNRIIQYHI